jgi:hypothetical protein
VKASDTAAWFAGIVAAIGVVWTGLSHARELRARAHGEGAEKAARLLALMNDIGLGGSDPTLDVARTQTLHDAQLRDLQRVIRLGVADFTARSLKPGVSLPTIFAVGAYTLTVLAGGVGLLGSGGANGSTTLGNLIAGLLYLVLAIAGFIWTPVLAVQRSRRIKQLRAAGVTIETGFFQDLRAIRNKFAAARRRRRQRDELLRG